MKKIAKIFSMLVFATSVQSVAFGDTNRFSAGVKIGTLGFGGEFEYAFTDQLSIRQGFNYIKLKDKNNDKKDSVMQIKRDAKFITFPLMLDYQPVQDFGFKLSAGVVYLGATKC